MKRVGLYVLVAVGLALAIAPGWAQGPYEADRVAMETAATGGNYAAAYSLAHKIMERAQGQAPETLTAQDIYTIGLANYYLAAEAFAEALRLQKLDEAQTAVATRLLGQIAPTVPVSTAVEVPAVRVVANGERITLEDYLVAGKTTIVDFTSEYCGPCKALAPRLEDLTKRRPDTVVVKVNINRPGTVGIDWQSPVARQFNLQSIPHLRIYGPDQQLQMEGRPALQQVLAWCEVQ